ncbi:MAG: AMP-binding protein, partial [Chloroflexota bacterium]
MGTSSKQKVQFNSLTLVDLLRERANGQEERLAYIFLEDGEDNETRITFQELDHQARRIAAWLQNKKLKGERALLLYPPGLDYIATFFGCLYAGVIAVPAYPPRLNRPVPRLRAIANDAQASVVLTNQYYLTGIEKRFEHEPDLKNMTWLATEDVPIDNADNWKDQNIGADDLAFLQYTSGSTSSPKGVMLSHGNLMHNLAVIKHGFQIDSTTSGGFWLPSYHDMGLIGGILEPMFINGHSVIMPPVAFIQRPYRWLKAMTKYKITTSGGPNFAYQLCVDKITPEQRETLDLSHWTLAFMGAEPTRRETMEAFENTFVPHGFNPKAFYSCYGMAETTLIISGGNGPGPNKYIDADRKALREDKIVLKEREEEDSQSLVSTGSALLGQIIEIVDPQSLAVLPEDQVGEIWVSGPSIAQGYWNRTQQTQETFQLKLSKHSGNTFLRTGDLGFLSDGELYITGRLKDLIIIRGRNHYPQDIEMTVEHAHEAIATEAGAAFSIELDNEEKLVLVHEIKRSHRKADINEVVEAVRRAVAQSHEVQVHALILVKPISIPKTSSGKIQRHACKAGYLDGSLTVLAEWQVGDEITIPDNENETSAESVKRHEKSSRMLEIEAWLVNHIAGELKIGKHKINVVVPFLDYGLDSVQAVSLAGELEIWLDRTIPPTLAWDYPNIEILAQYLVGEELPQPNQINTQAVVKEIKNEPIAIIGVGCRFPGADNPDEFWDLLKDGVDAISEVPDDRWHSDAYYEEEHAKGKMVTKWGGFLKNVKDFDPAFFGISPREASRMDPQQRLLLEVTWEALENAGIPPTSLANSATGVFVGISSYDYSQFQFSDHTQIDAYAGTGNAHSIAANRLSYVLNLRGPSMALDTACSSSLVSIHLACQSLLSGESEMALAGGVNLILTPELNITFSQAHMMAPDGRCKTFDTKADGYVRGEGCGMIILKRSADALRDGDQILGLVRGSAVNQDGRSNGLTAPNGPSQQAVINQAMQNAGVSAEEIGYFEAHGTGTPLGDPIEVQSLRAVVDPEVAEEDTLYFGSVKTNLGHLEAAAGIAGVIKVVLSLQHQQIPPHLHREELNPYIPLDGTALKIPTALTPWQRSEKSRLSGISSFGFGGTNAHVILAEAPLPAPIPENKVERPAQMLTLSAKAPASLTMLAKHYANYLGQEHSPALADIAYSANTGRDHFDHRLAVWGETKESLQASLQDFATGNDNFNLMHHHVLQRTQPTTAFLFSGQGAQYVGMGKQLYETNPVFREAIETCQEILKPLLDIPLPDLLFHDNADKLNQTVYTQPALFALEYALAKTWAVWGVRPDFVIGHSLGEYAAACIAGAFSLEDGLKLIAKRGELMGTLPAGGVMAAVFASQSQLADTMINYTDKVSFAAFNSPENTVISGDGRAIDKILGEITQTGIKHKLLKVSHAFHSPLMDNILEAFEDTANSLAYQPLQIPLVSNLTGETLPVGTILDAGYWRDHIRQPVQFAQGMKLLANENCEIFLEVGPHTTLLGMGRGVLPDADSAWLPSLTRNKADWGIILESLGRFYTLGLTIDWPGFDSGYTRQQVPLPTYTFDRQPYWIEVSTHGTTSTVNSRLSVGSRVPGEKIAFEMDMDTNISAAELIQVALQAAVKADLGLDYWPEEIVYQEPLKYSEGYSLRINLTPVDA